MYVVNSTCTLICIPAHRLPPGQFTTYRQVLDRQLERQLRQAIGDGFSIFRIGMNRGADLWAAEMVIRLRQEFPHIQLHAYLPYETQASNWLECWRELYFDLLAHVDEVVYLQTHYSKGCIPRRNMEILTGAARLIAVHDNVADGGINRAIGYAEERGIETIVLRVTEGPDSYCFRPGEVIQLGDQIRSQTSSAYSEGFSTSTSAIRRA